MRGARNISKVTPHSGPRLGRAPKTSETQRGLPADIDWDLRLP